MRQFNLLTFCAVLFGSLAPAPAAACGGFFCDGAQPVNQAAERIVFVDNGNGTITAVIEIQYQGEAEQFSWLLPISTAPSDGEIGVASVQAFDRLQAATNPRYTLTTRVEGECREEDRNESAGGDDGVSGGFEQDAGAVFVPEPESPVQVEASGAVGPFEWVVISVAEGADEPAQEAVEWLQDNGYDVPEGAPSLIRPYLEDGLFLLALRLTKDAETGSIRPIVLTYDADRAMIPVKLTAVAANDDMGVMTWLLGQGRAVPENYLSLELNEARLNWFNANTNYNDVVVAAADDAGGQGFVTEFAGSTQGFQGTVWSQYEQELWVYYSESAFSDFEAAFLEAYYNWSGYDGFWDAVRSAVTLPMDSSIEDLQLCPSCRSGDLEASLSDWVEALEENVIAPMRVVQDLLDAQPQVTRLYTTLSAEEMTLDPLFTFNSELPEVSNVHTAERVIECNPQIYQFEAPWHVDLPQGTRVRGIGNAWPDELSSLPPNFRIERQASSGSGRVLEDNRETIEAALEEYNASVPSAEEIADASSPGETEAVGGSSEPDSGDTQASDPGDDSDTSSSDSTGEESAVDASVPDASATAAEMDDGDDDWGWCGVVRARPSGVNGAGPWGAVALLGLALGVRRRARRASLAPRG